MYYLCLHYISDFRFLYNFLIFIQFHVSFKESFYWINTICIYHSTVCLLMDQIGRWNSFSGGTRKWKNIVIRQWFWWNLARFLRRRGLKGLRQGLNSLEYSAIKGVFYAVTRKTATRWNSFRVEWRFNGRGLIIVSARILIPAGYTFPFSTGSSSLLRNLDRLQKTD